MTLRDCIIGLRCPECDSKEYFIDERRGEIVCTSCGLVLDDHLIDERVDWRAYSAKEFCKRARTGPPSNSLIHDGGLSTVIDGSNKDIYGNSFVGNQRAKAYKLRKWQSRSKFFDNKDRNFTQAIIELNRMGADLGLPNQAKVVAASVYRKAIDENLIRGRTIISVMTSCIYYACRFLEIPRSLDDLVAVSGVERKRVSQHYRAIMRKLKLKAPVASPISYVPNFISKLSLSSKVEMKTYDLLKDERLIGFVQGKDPTGVCGAFIYIAARVCDERRTQSEIARVTKSTAVTIRKHYKKLIGKLMIDFV